MESFMEKLWWLKNERDFKHFSPNTLFLLDVENSRKIKKDLSSHQPVVL